jgi:chromosome segregation ATPase
LNETATGTREQLREAEAAGAALSRELDTSKETSARFEASSAGLTRRLAALEEENEAEGASLKRAVGEKQLAQAAREAVEGAMVAKDAECTRLNDAVEYYRGELSTAEERHTMLEDRLESTEEKLAASKQLEPVRVEEIGGLTVTVAGLEAEKTTLTNDLHRVKGELAELDRCAGELKNTYTALCQEHDAAVRERDRLQGLEVEGKEQYRQVRGELGSAQRDLETTSRELSEATKHAEGAMHDAEALRLQVEEGRTAAQEAEGAARGVREELAQTAQSLQLEKRETAKQREEAERLAGQLQRVEGTKSRLEEALKDTQEDSNTANASLSAVRRDLRAALEDKEAADRAREAVETDCQALKNVYAKTSEGDVDSKNHGCVVLRFWRS